MASSTSPDAIRSREAPDGRLTEPSDYGALNAVYLALFATVVAAWTRKSEDDAIPNSELVPLGVATFALSKVVAREKIGTWVREPFVEEGVDHEPRHPRGRGLRRAVGALLSCTRCTGAWAALGLVGLRVASPPAGRLATTVLAASGVNDFLQAAFQYATGKANEADR
jgi:Protein of unknown function (DUF1360)